MRLAKPKKKGLIHILFSRVLIIALLILLQVVIFIGIYLFLADSVPFFTAFVVLFTFAMIFYVFNSEMDSSAKLTWLLILAIAPIPGALFLAYTRIILCYRVDTSRV